MKNKIIEIKNNLINFFKDPKEVISFFLPIILTLCLLIPVPYYIKMGGGTIKIDKEISIKNSYKSNGSLEALYVREGKGTVLTYLLSYIFPSFEREKANDVTLDNESEKDYNLRERYSFTSSLDAATKVAFESAGKKVNISSSRYIVLYIDKGAKTELNVGDVILEVDGVKITSYDQIASILKSKRVGDSFSILVSRDGKKIDTNSSAILVDGSPKIGIVLSNEIKYSSDPKVDFSFDGRQAGPSGGLMISLSIYNKLVKKDITGGLKVFGTGTIDTSGNVGIIGGVKHKLMAADKKDADIVLVPSGNYLEALKYKKKNNYKFKLVKVNTFDDAISALDKITN